MNKHLSSRALSLALWCAVAVVTTFAQTNNPPSATTPVARDQTATTTTTTNQAATPATSRQPVQQQQQQQSRSSALDLAEYGVEIVPDERVLVMMAALEAAGFNPPRAGRETTGFRAQVRQDQAGLNADLRDRLRRFYESHKMRLPAPVDDAEAAAQEAQQAARYISLALALGELPTLNAPARTDDLPAGVLEVLDFTPLVREFYGTSGIKERLPQYVKAHAEEAARLRASVSEMVRLVLSYLHTRPITTTFERAPVKNENSADASKKKQTQRRSVLRETPRRFRVVPDLLSVTGAVNFRVVGDDYYVIVPQGINPVASEVRRAYVQYVVDPIVVRFNREIAARRPALKALLDERVKAGSQGSSFADSSINPDIFFAVERSLAAAADARLTLTTQLARLAVGTSEQLKRATSDAERQEIIKEDQIARKRITDERTAQLSDAYERGAVLAFHFAEQLQGLETSGFDIASFLGDMVASFDPLRETARPNEFAEVRKRVNAARLERIEEARRAADRNSSNPASAARSRLLDQLSGIETLLRAKNYTEAETRLRTLLQEHQSEPRIHFALGQTASLSAGEAFDENLRDERLNRALAHYRMAFNTASPDTDRALISRAHEASGRIYAFLDKSVEAVKAFDAAIQIGEVAGGAYNEARAGKEKLTEPQQQPPTQRQQP